MQTRSTLAVNQIEKAQCRHEQHEETRKCEWVEPCMSEGTSNQSQCSNNRKAERIWSMPSASFRKSFSHLLPFRLYWLSASIAVRPRGRSGRSSHGFNSDPSNRSAVIVTYAIFWVPRAKSHVSPASSLRRKPHFECGGANVGIDVLSVFDEVVLEHMHQLARGLVERGFVRRLDCCMSSSSDLRGASEAPRLSRF
jgi:hypothetical protein